MRYRQGLKAAACMALACSFLTAHAELAWAGNAIATLAPTTNDSALRIATDAYIFGYPLVTMEMTRRVMTNVVAPNGKLAPMGQFANLRNYPSASDKEVTAPNADTLYSLAWLNLSQEPYILSIPNADGRYYLMPMLDGWTTVFQDPGARTTGTKAQTYAISGPGWHGTLPAGVKQYKSATYLVWILGRAYCQGTPEDYTQVHNFQDQLSLTPLSAYGKPYKPLAGVTDPTVDMKTPVRDQVDHLDTTSYFKMLATLMKENPPTKEDAPYVSKFATIGIVPGQDFDLSKASASLGQDLAAVPKQAQREIIELLQKGGTVDDGWSYFKKTGVYGTDYLQRALVTAVGLGANRPADAIYPVSTVDADGQPYNGASNYIMHFDKGKTPPVNGFWSLTMYDGNYFFVPNVLNRYDVSERSPFKYNEDGSLDIYIQKESPGKDKESNWLPAPADKFVLMLRMYWPKEAVIDGQYHAPPVKRVS